MVKVRVVERGVIVIPKEVRERLGITKGTVLDLRVEGRRLILEVTDLWATLRERGRRIRVDVDEAEKELDEADEEWLGRLRRQSSTATQ